MSYTLKKSEIVRGKKRLQEIFTTGTEFEGSLLRSRVRIYPRKNEPRIKIGFIPGRSIKRAVDRNRVKRLMREAYRLHKSILLQPALFSQHNIEVIFIYTPKVPAQIASLTLRETEADVKTILKSITKRWFR